MDDNFWVTWSSLIPETMSQTQIDEILLSPELPAKDDPATYEYK